MITLPCPICFEKVKFLMDGHSLYNPGTAVCDTCKNSWDLGPISDIEHAENEWNFKQPRYTDEALERATKRELDRRKEIRKNVAGGK